MVWCGVVWCGVVFYKRFDTRVTMGAHGQNRIKVQKRLRTPEAHLSLLQVQSFCLWLCGRADMSVLASLQTTTCLAWLRMLLAGYLWCGASRHLSCKRPEREGSNLQVVAGELVNFLAYQGSHGEDGPLDLDMLSSGAVVSSNLIPETHFVKPKPFNLGPRFDVGLNCSASSHKIWFWGLRCDDVQKLRCERRCGKTAARTSNLSRVAKTQQSRYGKSAETPTTRA